MITTTTGKVVTAMKSLEEIKGQQVSKKAAKELFHLKAQMRETVDFYLEQVGEIVDRLHLKMENGVITFKDDVERELFIQEMRELEDTEARLDCDKVDLTEEDIKISEQFVDQTGEFVDL